MNASGKNVSVVNEFCQKRLENVTWYHTVYEIPPKISFSFNMCSIATCFGHNKQRCFKEWSNQLSDAQNIIRTSMYVRHICSRWYTPDFHTYSPLAYEHLSHRGTKSFTRTGVQAICVKCLLLTPLEADSVWCLEIPVCFWVIILKCRMPNYNEKDNLLRIFRRSYSIYIKPSLPSLLSTIKKTVN